MPFHLTSLLGSQVSAQEVHLAGIVGGILIAIYGAAGLLTWLLIDRKRARSIDRL